MARKAGKIVIELTNTGAERLRKDLIALGPAGEKALKRLDRATKSTTPGFKFLDKSVKELKGSMSGLESHAGPLGRVLGSMGPAGQAAAVGIGAIAFAGAAALKVSIDATREFSALAKAADDLGLKTDTFQALKHQADLAGVSFEQVGGNLRAFQVGSAEAALGTGALTEKLKNSHPDLLKTILLQETMEGRLNAVARALSNADSEQEKTLISTAAFGESGRSMIRVLGDQEDAIGSLVFQARSMGLVVDESILRKSEEMEDRLSIAAQVIDIQLKTAFVDLAPIIVTTMEKGAIAVRGFVDVVELLKKPKELFNIGENLITLDLDVKAAESKLVKLSNTYEKRLAKIKNLDRLATGVARSAGDLSPGRVILADGTVKFDARLQLLERRLEKARNNVTKATKKFDDAFSQRPDQQSSAGGGGGKPADPDPGGGISAKIAKMAAEQAAAAAAARQLADEQRLLTQITARHIDPQTRYNESLAELNTIRDRLDPAVYAAEEARLLAIRDKSIEKLEIENARKERAAQLASTLTGLVTQIITPQDEYNRLLAELKDLKPYLTVEQYAEALRNAEDALKAANAEEEKRLALARDAAQVRAGLLTDTERLAQEIEKLGKLRSKVDGDGGLTTDEYSKAVEAATKRYEDLNQKGRDHLDILDLMEQGLNGQIDSWEDFGKVALSVLVDIARQALITKSQTSGSSGGGGGILEAIGSFLGFGGGGSSGGSSGGSGGGGLDGIIDGITNFFSGGSAKSSPGVTGGSFGGSSKPAFSNDNLISGLAANSNSGGGFNVVVKNLGTPQQATASKPVGGGNNDIELTMTDIVKQTTGKAIADGSFDDILGGRFGITRQPGRSG